MNFCEINKIEICDINGFHHIIIKLVKVNVKNG